MNTEPTLSTYIMTQINCDISFYDKKQFNKLRGYASMNQAPEDSHVDNNYKDMPKICQWVKTSYKG